MTRSAAGSGAGAVEPLVCLDAAAPGVAPTRFAEQQPRLARGGVNALLATIAAIEGPEFALANLGAWWAADRNPAVPVRVTGSVEEIRRTVAAGETAVVPHLQGSAAFAGDLSLVDAFAALGVRVVQLTYNQAILAGDGCLEERDAGLSAFGRDLLLRLQEVGIAVDLSHAGERVCLDAFELGRGPIIATHANARAVYEHPRNLSDRVIDRIAAGGGVIGLCAFAGFVSADTVPTLDQLLDHAVHIAERVGAEHLGIGLDFAYEDEYDPERFGFDPRWYPRPPWTWPTGIEWWEDTRNIGPRLRDRGFSEAEVRGVLGENFLRAFEQAWKLGTNSWSRRACLVSRHALKES